MRLHTRLSCAWTVGLAVACVSAFFPAASAQAKGKFVVFDQQGAAATAATCINTKGVVAGFWVSNDDVAHGFVRSPDGTIASFDAPNFVGTAAAAINDSGTVVGNLLDSFDRSHGFVRKP